MESKWSSTFIMIFIYTLSDQKMANTFLFSPSFNRKDFLWSLRWPQCKPNGRVKLFFLGVIFHHAPTSSMRLQFMALEERENMRHCILCLHTNCRKDNNQICKPKMSSSMIWLHYCWNTQKSCFLDWVPLIFIIVLSSGSTGAVLCIKAL